MLLPEGAKMMTAECGMRFLADFIDGDRLFQDRISGTQSRPLPHAAEAGRGNGGALGGNEGMRFGICRQTRVELISLSSRA